MKIAAALLLCALPCWASASPYDPLIDSVAQQNGLDRFVLRAIAQQESKKHPWTFNADGEGFYFADKRTAVSALWSLTSSPWMAKIVPPKGSGKMVRRFFSTQRAAQAFINGYQRSLLTQGKATLNQRYDDSKAVKNGEARVRKLWLVNTDIGIAQVNYRFHGQDRGTVQRWFDPQYNLAYAAKLLADHKRKHGTDLAAAGYYHSGTKALREQYMSRFMPIYNKEKTRAGLTVAAN